MRLHFCYHLFIFLSIAFPISRLTATMEKMKETVATVPLTNSGAQAENASSLSPFATQFMTVATAAMNLIIVCNRFSDRFTSSCCKMSFNFNHSVQTVNFCHEKLVYLNLYFCIFVYLIFPPLNQKTILSMLFNK